MVYVFITSILIMFGFTAVAAQNPTTSTITETTVPTPGMVITEDTTFTPRSICFS